MHELDRIEELILAEGGTAAAPHCVARTNEFLARTRKTMNWPEWQAFATRQFRDHAAFPLLCEDPCASYSVRKPRGYAGDAVLLDFLYGGGLSTPMVDAASEIGRELYRQVCDGPTTAALRGRCDYLASSLEELCADGRPSRVLSVACGHLREAARLSAGGLWPERLVVLDHDPRSLAVVEAEYGGRVQRIHASALRLLSPEVDVGQFDFIYSAGLLDYLSDISAARLIEALARRLTPGGRLLVCNMTPQTFGSGYMEAVMDWWLIYRTPAQMERLRSVIKLH
jgi:extracellular factor (EF) 3-hydroxypalmitic acid methyl ester biosynthesis protein